MIPTVRAKLLEDKKGLVVGIANENSIAWGCAKAFRTAGAEVAVTWLNDKARPHVEPLAKEINALGGDVIELPDGLRITPRPLRPEAPFGTYEDHRMVMAAAVLGLAVPGITVADPQTVAKTFPGFADVWESLVRGDAPPETAW